MGGYPCLSTWLINSAKDFIAKVDSELKQVGKIYHNTERFSVFGANLFIDMRSGNFYTYEINKDLGYRPFDLNQALITSYMSWIYSDLIERKRRWVMD
jgi:hypothetical protein